jgi:hypothetical protein
MKGVLESRALLPFLTWGPGFVWEIIGFVDR